MRREWVLYESHGGIAARWHLVETLREHEQRTLGNRLHAVRITDIRRPPRPTCKACLKHVRRLFTAPQIGTARLQRKLS